MRMNQSSSNSNMPRSTVETLKQIQKQGLSVSLVPSDKKKTIPLSESLDSSESSEIRMTQAALLSDKTRVPLRSSSDSKASGLHSRITTTSEPRVSSGHTTLQNIYLEPRSSGSQNRSSQPVNSESKTQSWTTPINSPPSDNKPQTSSNRMVQSVSIPFESKSQSGSGRLSQNITSLPEGKNQSNAGRLSQNITVLPENKNQNSRNALNALPENKSQNRLNQIPETISQANQNRMSQSHALLAEGKTENRSVSSPTVEKVVSYRNQVRTSKIHINVSEVKSSAGQQNVPQKFVDSKGNQSKLNASRQVEISNISRGNQNVKIMPDNSQVRLRQSSSAVSEVQNVSQSSSQASIIENKANNSSRLICRVDSIPCSISPKFSPAAEGKLSSVTQLRLHQNITASSDSQSPVHSKISQNISLQSEGKIASQASKFPGTPAGSDASSDINSSSMAVRSGVKRAPAASSSAIAKKKCTKRTSSAAERSGKTSSSSEGIMLSSPEAGTADDQQFFSNLKSRTRDLTITPIKPNALARGKLIMETSEKDGPKVLCPSCNNYSYNLKWCQTCKSQLHPTLVFAQDSEVVRHIPIVLANTTVSNVTTNISVSKQIIVNQYAAPQFVNQGQSIHFEENTEKKIFINASPVIQASPRGKGRGRTRRKFEEPVCLTLSSDEEEPTDESFTSLSVQIPANISHAFPMESEGSKSDQSSPDINQEENQESDDPQFPGVTDIHPKHLDDEMEFDDEDQDELEEIEGMEEDEELVEEEEEEEEEEEDCSEEEEEEEVPPEEEIEDDEQVHIKLPIDKLNCVEQPLHCRSIRIGSLKVHPDNDAKFVPVFMSMDGISFKVPFLPDSPRKLNLVLKAADITLMFAHFGRCLPIIFIFTTVSFGEIVRRGLNMTNSDGPYFDPNSKDEKKKKITFLIEHMTEDHRRFLRYSFPGEKKVKEIDQKTANEILVKSTPSNSYSKSDSSVFRNSPAENQISPPFIPVQAVLKPHPPVPVTKILTYPPPPQTGGIAITSEDLACLDEGEFLNDAIIDFYLKYVFYEKLSDYHREKTHVFSSYFYPRLTHKPERSRPGEDGQKAMQVRRHSQVKTWTRHVDIFSKDYIIIPVNQNVHWFLAIICYPGHVPDVTNVPIKSETKINKSADNVTSTDDQEEANKLAVKEHSTSTEGNNPNPDENSMSGSNNSLYDEEECPDSEELMPEAPDSSTHPDGNKRRKETPCICIFDSLSGPNRWRIAATLREYLEMEWKMKKGTKKVFDRNTMQGFVVKCPQQTNFSDCGVYLLQYVESFFETPIPYFGNPMPDLMNWFSDTKIAQKRQEIKDLISNLQKRQSANSASLTTRKANQPDSVPSSPATVQQTDNR